MNFGDTASVTGNSIKFTTTEVATVKVWWAVGKAGRQITILDSAGKAVATSKDNSADNTAVRSTFKLNEPGTYYLGNSVGNNYIFKVLVRYGNVPLNDWSTIDAPVINSAKDSGDGKIIVNVTSAVSEADAEIVKVTMFDKDGTPSGEDSNPSTGVAVPVASMAVLMTGAAVTIYIAKRKRG